LHTRIQLVAEYERVAAGARQALETLFDTRDEVGRIVRADRQELNLVEVLSPIAGQILGSEVLLEKKKLLLHRLVRRAKLSLSVDGEAGEGKRAGEQERADTNHHGYPCDTPHGGWRFAYGSREL
jgi:hypothetical protein